MPLSPCARQVHQLEVLSNKVKLKRAGKTKYKEDYSPLMQARLEEAYRCLYLHRYLRCCALLDERMRSPSAALGLSERAGASAQVCGARGGGDAAAQGLFLALGPQLVFMLVREASLLAPPPTAVSVCVCGRVARVVALLIVAVP